MESDAQRMLDVKHCLQCAMPIVVKTGTQYCNLCLPKIQGLGRDGLTRAVNSVLLLTAFDRKFLQSAHVAAI